MTEPMISVRNISKEYKLGASMSSDTVRDMLMDGVKKLLMRKSNNDEQTKDRFWALNDVSFDIAKGEVVGVIGRNGAGKSTLLKILSQITEPTKGEIHIKGRVASLLEVGTGFHQELSGRENVFLNGSILGMSHREIKECYDDIVEFAGTGDFMDTPVKRYSSGMLVRLAFAVAAHLQPEILLVDEVLAVGDIEFQKKCLGKMQDVAEHGRTVLFVSHNMGLISRLCHRVIMLDGGAVALDSNTADGVSAYLALGSNNAEASVDFENFKSRSGDRTAKVINGSLKNAKGELSTNFSMGDDISFEFTVEYKNIGAKYCHSIEIINSDGTAIHQLVDRDAMDDDLSGVNKRVLRASLKNIMLYPDRYYITLWVGNPQGARADRLDSCMSFTVEISSDILDRDLSKKYGLVHAVADWTWDDA